MSDLPPVPPPDSRTPPTTPHGIGPMPGAAAPERNALGMSAFIVSIVGFCVPVLPTIAALVLGAVAVFRRPRGFAIAALVIGVIQLLAWIVGVVLLFTLLMPGIESKTNAMGALLTAVADEHDNGVDRFPIGAPPQFDALDGWGRPYRVEVIRTEGARTVFVWCAGADGEFDSSDDFVAACDPIDAASRAGKPEMPFD